MNRRLFKFIVSVFIILPGLCYAVASAVDGIAISPIRVDLSQKTTMASISIFNKTDVAVGMQADVKAWTKKNGEDIYTPSHDLLVTPPIFKINPGAQQVIRVALRRPPLPDQVLAYRIFLSELPIHKNKEDNAIQFLVRFGIPAYVAPIAPVPNKESIKPKR